MTSLEIEMQYISLVAPTISCLGSFIDDQDKARAEIFFDWITEWLTFDQMVMDAVRHNDDIGELNKELQRIEIDKNRFLNEIRLKESDLRIFMQTCSTVSRDIIGKTTFEEIIPFIERVNKELFVKIPDFMDNVESAIDKHIVSVTAC